MKTSRPKKSKRTIPVNRSFFQAFLIATIIVFLGASNFAGAGDFTTRIQMSAELIPEANKLKANAEIEAFVGNADYVRFFISEDASIKKVLIGGQKSSYEFSNGIFIAPVKTAKNGFVKIGIAYEAVYDDPVPVLPVNTDNPGYGVTGTISDAGTFLLSGSGWHPRMLNGKASYDLTVKAPGDTIAVTAGKYLGAQTDGAFTITRWEIENAPEGLSLSAADYQVTKKRAGNVDVMTFFLRESIDLSPKYLDATEKYILDYESLFGPYPFDKFAIVENFFPTGYGFPSYTLIGTTVLRLPFIVYTSLGHEIAHCWWGNGVLPKYSEGNWSEGLATYVADYLFKERQSPDEAREYRLQLLRNYSTLIDSSDDFPLAEFTSRVDPATKVVGYDKGAMFFHMLRKKTGEEIFWEGLRRIYSKFLFREASWNDFKSIYEELLNDSLDVFFEQWIRRAGAPLLSLADVTLKKSGQATIVKGKLVQKPPFYDLDVNLLLETKNSSLGKTVSLEGRSASFEFKTNEPPETLAADPAADVFRKLYPSEIPPAINSLKASDNLIVAIALDDQKKYEPIAKLFAKAIGVDDFTIVVAKSLKGEETAESDVLWIGLPSDTDRMPRTPDGTILKNDFFTIAGTKYSMPEDAFFGVFSNPQSNGRVQAVFLPLSDENMETVVRKVPHYGKYSYLAFSKGQNTEKGTWPVKDSPLIHRFAEHKSIER